MKLIFYCFAVSLMEPGAAWRHFLAAIWQNLATWRHFLKKNECSRNFKPVTLIGNEIFPNVPESLAKL